MTTTAIIGHGKSPINKVWGDRIDACDAVIRMWNWAPWQQVRPWDYGKKYTYGFFEINNTEMSRFNRLNVETPALGWVANYMHSNIGKKTYQGTLPFPTQIFKTEWYDELGVKLGGMGEKGRLVLTRGTRAAAWAIAANKNDTVILVGFDNVKAGESLAIADGFPTEYINSSVCAPFRDYAGGLTKYSNHDYAVEGLLLRTLAFNRGTQLYFAEDVW